MLLKRLFVVSALTAFVSVTACKTPDAVTTLQSGADATVALPVTGGPGKVYVTPIEAAFVREMSESGNMFRNPEFWDFYAAHPDLAKDLLEMRWFEQLPDEKSSILAAAYSLGKHFILYLDMGIAIRADEFRSFAAAKLAAEPNMSSFALRQAFANSLPKATVWRGILLTAEEAARVRTDGIKASGFFQSEAMRNSFLAGEYLKKTTYSNHPSSAYDDMNRRLNGMTGHSVYASYSRWIEVTYAGCWLPPLQGGSLLRSLPGIKFYLFKVEVSELDLIRPNGMLYKLIGTKTNQIYKTTGLDGSPWSKSFGDPEFEMFIQYVAPDEIVGMTAYDQYPPKWGT